MLEFALGSKFGCSRLGTAGVSKPTLPLGYKFIVTSYYDVLFAR